MGRNARNHEVSSGGEEKTHREHYARPERKEDRKERKEAKQEVREKFQDQRMKISAELNTEYLTVPRQLKVKLAELKMLAKQNQDRGLKFQLPADLTAIEGRVNLIGDTYTEDLRYSERSMNNDLQVIRQTVRGLRVNLRRHTNHAEGTKEDHAHEPAQDTGPKRAEVSFDDPSKNMPKTSEEIKDPQAQTGGSAGVEDGSSSKTPTDTPTKAEVTFDPPATPDPKSSTVGEVEIGVGAPSRTVLDDQTIDIPDTGSSTDKKEVQSITEKPLDDEMSGLLFQVWDGLSDSEKQNVSMGEWKENSNSHIGLYFGDKSGEFVLDTNDNIYIKINDKNILIAGKDNRYITENVKNTLIEGIQMLVSDNPSAPKESSEAQNLDQTILEDLIKEWENIPDDLKKNVSLATWDKDVGVGMELHYEESGVKISAEALVKDNQLILVFNNNAYPDITLNLLNQDEVNPRNILKGLVETITLLVDPSYKEIHAQVQEKIGIYETTMAILFNIPTLSPNHEKLEKEKEIKAKLDDIQKKIDSNSLTKNDLIAMDKLLESVIPKAKDTIREKNLNIKECREQLNKQEKDLKHILENYDKIRVLHTQRSGETEVTMRYTEGLMPQNIKLNFYNNSFRNMWVLLRYPDKEHEKQLLQVALVATQAQLKEL